MQGELKLLSGYKNKYEEFKKICQRKTEEAAEAQTEMWKERDAKENYLEDLRKNRETAQKLLDEKDSSIKRLKTVVRCFQDKYPNDDLSEANMVQTTHGSVSSSTSELSSRGGGSVFPRHSASGKVGMFDDFVGSGSNCDENAGSAFEQIINNSQGVSKPSHLVYFSQIEGMYFECHKTPRVA